MAKNLLKNLLGEARAAKGVIDTKKLIAAIEAGYLPPNTIEYKKKKSFAPSSLVYGSGECPRYWYLAFEGGDFESENTPQEIANMQNGSYSHERIQKAVGNTDIVVSVEKKITYDDPPIFGFQDLELFWNDGNLPVEIKTTRDIAFQRRKDAGTALPYHRSQLLIYMYIQHADLGVILYENKDTHELYAVPLEMTPENKQWVENSFEWMRSVRKAWNDKQLPKKNYRVNSKICKTCPLSKVCATLPVEGDIELPSLEKLG